ncbi:hypothetical protein OUZ56_030014 [Daphnia magna]|uniref:Uncharacterized protein n=1 Tax=Daphnia magna TaxID=35525 RepID=A0ABR0B8H0_9CRUS|nr:hypothetical protein OUZ56_030014 [Daphnia magna]
MFISKLVGPRWECGTHKQIPLSDCSTGNHQLHISKTSNNGSFSADCPDRNCCPIGAPKPYQWHRCDEFIQFILKTINANKL